MSYALSDVRSEARAWCASYVAAFNAGDAAAISNHWSFPALIPQSDKQICFRSAERFDQNTELLLAFYRGQGVSRVERTLNEFLSMGRDTMAITVSDRMFDESGTELVAWKAAYVLQRGRGGWKAVMAQAEGELAAWRARGTPLGGI